jgi:hypothetical protein
MVSEDTFLSKRQEKILKILVAGGALSVEDIFDQLDDAYNLQDIKADLTILKRLSFIERRRRDQTTSWKIKI